MPKFDLVFAAPWMNAAGTLGFAPDTRGPVNITRLGAFITDPISAGARTPARGSRFISYPGGFLVHTGYPNPGLRAVLRRYGPRWRLSPVPVLVHLLVQALADLEQMLPFVESVEGVAGIEMGLPPDGDRQMAVQMVQAARGEIPVVLRLGLEQARACAGAAMAHGAAAVSLGAPRGILPGESGGLVQGRLYGPGIFPQALGVTRDLAREGLPVIAAGGVYSAGQADAMLSVGALAVQLDGVLWRGGWPGLNAPATE